MADPALTVHALTAASEADFRAVQAAAGCGCHCVAWWVPTWDAWEERTPAQNQALRADLFARGEHDGYLLRADGLAIGWCQVGPRDRLEKLVRTLRRPADPAVWAITCLLVVPAWRGRGLSLRFLAAILDDLRRRGVGRVEAYPVHGHQADRGDLWTGGVQMFARVGFRMLVDDPRHPVMVIDLNPASAPGG